MLQKEIEHTRTTTKTDATAAFLASLEDPKLPSLGDTDKKPPIEILPPGMSSLSLSISAPKKPLPTVKGSQQEPGKPLLLGAPPTTAPINGVTPPPTDSGDSSVVSPAESSQPGAPSTAESSQPGAPSTAESSQPGAPSTVESSQSGAPSTVESSQPEVPPPDSTQVGEESGEAGAPSVEVSNQPKPEGTSSLPDSSETGASNQVNSSESEPTKLADSSQSGAPTPPDSNQPEAPPPTTDLTQLPLDPKVAEQQLLDSIGPEVAKPSNSRSPFADLALLM